MKLIAGKLALLIGVNLGINLMFLDAASARFAREDIKFVPISRLLKNLELQRGDVVGATDKAMVDFRIGRLHAMAYALGVEEAPCNAQARPGTKYELPDFGHTADHSQFRVDKSKAKPESAQAKMHLKQAISHMQAALKTDPSLLTAKLGLAWCYEQAGDKTQALALYRDVFKNAYESEKDSKGGMYNWSISLETAEYMEKLLDPQKDKKELDQMKSRVAELEKLPRMVTPILIPLDTAAKLNELLVDCKVRFDLDGFGVREYSKWPSPKAAWLVIDSDKNGQINSGLKLVGQSSFWIFWKNGYEVLRSLDDDHDGKLIGTELRDMALWHDLNCNGISENGEVKPLSAYGISELKHDCKSNSNGILWNESGVVFTSGNTSASYDVVLPASTQQSKRQKPGVIPALPGVRPLHSL